MNISLVTSDSFRSGACVIGKCLKGKRYITKIADGRKKEQFTNSNSIKVA